MGRRIVVSRSLELMAFSAAFRTTFDPAFSCVKIAVVLTNTARRTAAERQASRIEGAAPKPIEATLSRASHPFNCAASCWAVQIGKANRNLMGIHPRGIAARTKQSDKRSLAALQLCTDKATREAVGSRNDNRHAAITPRSKALYSALMR